MRTIAASPPHQTSPRTGTPATVDEVFRGQPLAKRLFTAVRAAMETIGPADVRVTKSQVAFWRRHPFAAVWLPGRYLTGRPVAPLVLAVFLRERDTSPRWKQVVEPTPGRFTHHLELHAPSEVDGDVGRWLQQAWEEAS